MNDAFKDEHGSRIPSVAVIVPIRDEITRLPGLLADIESQTLRPTEVVVADGRSSDGSRAWLEQAAESRPWLSVVDNPDVVIPAALNRAMAATRADVVARMDAHVHYGPNYLATLVSALAEHPEAAGAACPLRTVGSGRWGRAIAAVLSSSLGLGGSPHRAQGPGRPVDHASCPAYRRVAVEAVGGWDETMLSNEDAELDYRLRSQVGPLWLAPDDYSVWAVRETLPALARQMRRYGFYRARTVNLRPRSAKLRHLGPPLATLAVLAGLMPVSRRVSLAAGGYLLSAAAGGAMIARRSGESPLRGALVVPVVHLSWGWGFIVGLVTHAGATPQLGLAQRLAER